jgi:hypothetical protein
MLAPESIEFASESGKYGTFDPKNKIESKQSIHESWFHHGWLKVKSHLKDIA